MCFAGKDCTRYKGHAMYYGSKVYYAIIGYITEIICNEKNVAYPVFFFSQFFFFYFHYFFFIFSRFPQWVFINFRVNWNGILENRLCPPSLHATIASWLLLDFLFIIHYSSFVLYFFLHYPVEMFSSSFFLPPWLLYLSGCLCMHLWGRFFLFHTNIPFNFCFYILNRRCERWTEILVYKAKMYHWDRERESHCIWSVTLYFFQGNACHISAVHHRMDQTELINCL